MDLVVAASALKQGVTEAQIEYVIAHCGLVFDEPAPLESTIPYDRSVYLGDDQRGVALEIAAIGLDNGDLVVVHAMKLRKKYRDRYNEALPYRRLA